MRDPIFVPIWSKVQVAWGLHLWLASEEAVILETLPLKICGV